MTRGYTKEGRESIAAAIASGKGRVIARSSRNTIKLRGVPKADCYQAPPERSAWPG